MNVHVTDGNYRYQIIDGVLYTLNFDMSVAYEIADITQAQVDALDKGQKIEVETRGKNWGFRIEIRKY